jgi:hypothetical protein
VNNHDSYFGVTGGPDGSSDVSESDSTYIWAYQGGLGEDIQLHQL